MAGPPAAWPGVSSIVTRRPRAKRQRRGDVVADVALRPAVRRAPSTRESAHTWMPPFEVARRAAARRGPDGSSSPARATTASAPCVVSTRRGTGRTRTSRPAACPRAWRTSCTRRRPPCPRSAGRPSPQRAGRAMRRRRFDHRQSARAARRTLSHPWSNDDCRSGHRRAARASATRRTRARRIGTPRGPHRRRRPRRTLRVGSGMASASATGPSLIHRRVHRRSGRPAGVARPRRRSLPVRHRSPLRPSDGRHPRAAERRTRSRSTAASDEFEQHAPQTLTRACATPARSAQAPRWSRRARQSPISLAT